MRSIYVRNDLPVCFCTNCPQFFSENCLRYRPPHAGRQLATREAVAADQIHGHPRSGSSTCALWPSGADRLRLLAWCCTLFSLSLFAMQLSVFNISLIKIYIILICPKKRPWVASAAAKCQAPLATQVEQSIQRSLQNLGTSYIDSLVMHSPMPTLEENLEVWISSWVSMMNNDNDGFRYQISLAV